MLMGISEKIIFWGVVGQYALYYFGLGPIAVLLICWPAIFLTLGAVACEGRIVIPQLGWIWVFSMFGILILGLTLFYFNGYGGTYLARWPLSFGLAAFLPIVGFLIDERVVSRAATILGLQTAIYCVIALIAGAVGWNFVHSSFIPKLSLLPNEYFTITLWGGEIATAEWRPVSFAPYATYAGAISCVYAIACFGEPKKWLLSVGFLGWLALNLLSLARTAWIALFIGVGVFLLVQIPRKYVIAFIGFNLMLGAVFFPELSRLSGDVLYRIEQYRPTSTEVRKNLKSIAFNEWRFGGHPTAGLGQSVPGGTVVADMPIGTHDTINTNLMLRGVIGLGLLFLPLALTLLFGGIYATSATDAIAMALLVILLLYTFTENFEGIIQYCWPALLFFGSILKRNSSSVPL
jgi:hypothetical protein